MKKICALTMARDDEFFLRRWVAYYGNALGRENLYVYLDGTDQVLEGNWYDGVHITFVNHEEMDGQVQEGDRKRIDYLSARAAELFSSYDLVVGTDVDEFLVVDPSLKVTLTEYLDRCAIRTSLSALGIDVGQDLRHEGAVDDRLPFLSQRRYALLSPRYSKSCVLASPVAWGSGFHRVRKHNFHIADGLYLFHFGCVDAERLKQRFSNRERLTNGWGGHMARRKHTIDLVSSKPSRMWDTSVCHARRIQNIFRQWQAWNKPTMLGMKWVVEIPERYRGIV